MSKSRVLVVDADILVRTPLAEYLRECGYQVLEAADASEAQALLLDEAWTVGVALIDLDAAKEIGFALARWIREKFPGLHVILAGTVAGAVEKAGDLCQDGPALTKPYDHRLVLSRIKRLLAEREADGADRS